MSQKRNQEFKGYPDHFRAAGRTYGNEEPRAWVSLEISRTWQLGENGCGHALESKMAAACEEHGGVEGRSGYSKLEGGALLLPLAEMRVKEDGFREAEAYS